MLPKNKDKIKEYKEKLSKKAIGNKNGVGAKRTKKFVDNLKRMRTGKKRPGSWIEKMKKNRTGKCVGIKNLEWKGDKAGYSALHTWIRRWKGNPNYCENCGKIGKKISRVWNIQWANIDHTYHRVLEDFIGMCPSCHKNYDIKNNLWQK